MDSTKTEKEKGHGPGSHNSVEIEGVSWPPLVSKESLKAIKNFDVRNDDVWIASYPKAGTHWVAEICHLILNNGDLEKVDRQQEPLPLEFEAMATISELAKFGGTERLPRYRAAPGWKSPRVIVTHVPRSFLPDQLLKEKKGKIITPVRNLKDTMVSYYHFYKGMMAHKLKDLTFAESLEVNCFGDKINYSSWFDHVLEYWEHRHDDGNLVLKYEDMKRDTRGAVIQIADHLERPLSDEVIDKITGLVSMEKMKTRYHVAGEPREFKDDGTAIKSGAPNLMRKGIVGDWKSAFTVAQNERVDELYREKMKDTDLEFDFGL
ncbi:sulfotransferase family cytosolic 1B member 1-like [Asterias rubens]|uniref:sulfotransferase family cytosolic 1B member 1-like n=1 Tax=Asterias rubens TaxID=7604 RepID=UPI0014556FAC|nr:sulfotransferase family cytosolic 1B member 1-like [Asterias rubens]